MSQFDAAKCVGCGMPCHVDMQDAAPIVGEDDVIDSR